jgi:hypothetical protein
MKGPSSYIPGANIAVHVHPLEYHSVLFRPYTDALLFYTNRANAGITKGEFKRILPITRQYDAMFFHFIRPSMPAPRIGIPGLNHLFIKAIRLHVDMLTFLKTNALFLFR